MIGISLFEKHLKREVKFDQSHSFARLMNRDIRSLLRVVHELASVSRKVDEKMNRIKKYATSDIVKSRQVNGLKEVVEAAGIGFDQLLKMRVMDLIYFDGSLEDPVECVVDELEQLCQELDCVERECAKIVRRKAH